MFGDGRLLLDYPDFVAETWLSMASATWWVKRIFLLIKSKSSRFYTTPQPPKPSMLHVIDGSWVSHFDFSFFITKKITGTK